MPKVVNMPINTFADVLTVAAMFPDWRKAYEHFKTRQIDNDIAAVFFERYGQDVMPSVAFQRMFNDAKA